MTFSPALSLLLALPYHLASYGGRYGYGVTWRVLAYPLGFVAPLTAAPGLGWAASLYALVVLAAVGLATVREISFGRAFLASLAVAALTLLAARELLAG